MFLRKFRPAPLLFCLLPAFVAGQTVAAPPSPADPLARLLAARDANNLLDPALKPWHMLATFDLLDSKGAVTEHGTFEEWWAAPDHWRQHIASPSYNVDLVRSGAQYYALPHKPLPYLLSALVVDLSDPIPELDPDKISVTQEPKQFGQFTLDCFVTQVQGRGPAFGASPTYCLEPDRPLQLRFVTSSNVQQVVRNRPATFQAKSVDLEVRIMMAGHPVLQATITDLRATPVDANLAPSPDASAFTPPIRVGSGVVAGNKIGGPQPIYPLEAKMKHISGTVLLHAFIGPDGKIHTLEPIWSPDSSLAKAATDAVQKWTYKPYLLDGKPVDVETTITINFNFAP